MKRYFIDRASLINDGFIFVLEKLLKNNENIFFIIDSSNESYLNQYKTRDEDKYVYLKTILIYLKSKNLYEEINADDFCKIDVISNKISSFKNDEIYLIAQKNNTFHLFNCLINDYNKITFYTIKNNELTYFENNNIKDRKKPFYIANDIYINKVDTSNIDYVYSPKYGYLKLFKNNVMSGGEGKCYRTYKNLYCKIFNEKHLTYINYKKIEYMLGLNIENDYLAWPKDFLYYNGDFVGYAMNNITNADSITKLKDDGFQKYKSPLDRATICLSLLKNIKYLHDHNIIGGDLKDDNILVKNIYEVFIIDCGSFQVDDFACDVVTKGWTDKEYNQENLHNNLRTLDDDYYSINRLIFELMVLKNPYYDPNNLEIDFENKYEKFNFPLEITNIGRDSPPYLIAWALLSDRIREFFYYFFKDPNNRKITYIDEWIEEFELLIKSYETYSRR